MNNLDLKRWETTEHGPDKLVAVLSHDKYDKDLRVEAAWSLIEMKKRGGQPVGVNRFIEELYRMPPKERREIVDALWKRLEPKVVAPLQATGDGRWADPTVPYKDATFSIFSDERLDLEPRLRDAMSRSLIEWVTGRDGDPPDKCLQTFETRMDNAAQQFGVEQVLRKIGFAAARRLPILLTAKGAIKSQRLDVVARVISDAKPTKGDPAAAAAYEKLRDDTSAEFARILVATLGDGYINEVRAETEEALRKSPNGQGLLKSPEELKKYFEKVRDERLTYLFAILKQVGRKPVTTALMAVANNDKETKEHRALALAALEGNVDASNDTALRSFVSIAKGSAPDDVKHGALLRISAYPPDQAVRAFYSLFDAPNWKVRYDGATSVLDILKKAGPSAKTSVREFLERLPARSDQKMGLGEPSSYAKAIDELKDKDPTAKQALLDSVNSRSLGAQLTALGWYVSAGTKNDLPALAKFEHDRAPVFKCAPDDECGWEKPGCPVAKPGGKPDEFDWKPVLTVGDYVQYCVRPQIEARAKAPVTPPAPKR